MKNKIKKVAFLTSGGDAPGMNAVIRAIVRSCIYNNITPVAIHKGYDGLIQGEFEEMNARSVKGIINKGGTFIKTARSSEFKTKSGRKKAYNNLLDSSIDALVVIGGDVGGNKAVQVDSPTFKLLPFSKKDLFAVDLAKKYKINCFTLSFMESPDIVKQFRGLYPNSVIYSKIESTTK